MMKSNKWTLAMVATLAGLTLSGCELTDLADSDDDEEDSERSLVLLRGQVADINGNPVFGATVDMKSAGGGWQGRTTTDSNGRFVWRDEFDQDEVFHGLGEKVLVRATNGDQVYHSVLCNSVYLEANRVNASPLTQHIMVNGAQDPSHLNADTLFDNWEQQSWSYCDSPFTSAFNAVAGNFNGFNIFNTELDFTDGSDFRNAMADLADNGTIDATGGSAAVTHSLPSLYPYATSWSLQYSGTVDGQAVSGSESFSPVTVTVDQLRGTLLELANNGNTEGFHIAALTVDAFDGTGLGEADSAVNAVVSGTVEDDLGVTSVDFSFTLDFSADNIR